MKRWLSYLLALMLLLSFPSLAEEAAEATDNLEAPAPEPTFADSILEWAGKLDPSANDLNGRANVAGEGGTGSLKMDGDLIELAIDGLGKAQFDGTTLVLETPEQTSVIDLTPLYSAVGSSIQSSIESAQNQHRLERLLQRAAIQLLLPSVSFTGNGIQIRLDDETLWQRVRAFVDQTLKDSDFKKLYAAYGPTLHTTIPEWPATVDEFAELWAELEGLEYTPIPGFTLEADVQSTSRGWDQQEIVATGQFTTRRTPGMPYIMGGTQVGFSFECLTDSDGFSVLARANSSDYRSAFDISLSLNGHENGLTGTLMVDAGATTLIELNAGVDEEEFDAQLSCRQDNQPIWTMDLIGRDDRERKTFNAELRYTDEQYGPSETLTVAALNVHYFENGCSGTLTTSETDVVFNYLGSDSHTHATAKVSTPYGRSSDYDLWVFNDGRDEYRVRCESRHSHRGRLYNQNAFTAQLSPTGLSFSYSNPQRLSSTVEGAISYVPQPDGFDFSIHFLADTQHLYNRYYIQPQPFDLHLLVGGSEYTFSVSGMVDMQVVKLDAKCTLDEEDNLSALSLGIESAFAMRPDRAQRYSLSWEPGKAVTSVDGVTYTLEKVSESLLELVYRLTDDQGGEPLLCTVSLDEALTTLSARVDAESGSLLELELSAADKTAIEPIDRTNAVEIDIMQLIQELMMPPEPAAPSAVEAAVEELPEAVEDAAETASDAVEDAAEAAVEAVEEAVEDAVEEVEEATETP